MLMELAGLAPRVAKSEARSRSGSCSVVILPSRRQTDRNSPNPIRPELSLRVHNKCFNRMGIAIRRPEGRIAQHAAAGKNGPGHMGLKRPPQTVRWAC